MKRFFTGLLVVFMGVFPFMLPPLSAGTPDTYGMSSRASATGGGLVGSKINDPFWTYQNPSFLTGTKGIVTSLGIMGTSEFFYPIEDVVIQNEASGKSIELGSFKTDYSNLFGMNLGLILPISKVTMGVTTFLPFGSLASVNTGEAYVPVYSLYFNNPKRFSLIGGGAVEIFQNFSLGASANVYLTTGASTQINLNAQNSSVALAMDIKPAVSPIVGMRYGWNGFYMDLSYHGEVDYLMQLKNKTDLILFGSTRSGGEVSFPVIEFLAKSSMFYDPAMVGMGISKVFDNGLQLASRFHWKNWKKYRPPLSEVDFVNPGDLDSKLPEIQFKNVISPSIGLEFPWRKAFLRTGYRYEPEHVVSQENNSNFIDTHVHIFSSGAGYLFSFAQIDLYLQCHKLQAKTIHKEVPFAMGYKEGGYSIGGFLLNYGLTLSKTF